MSKKPRSRTLYMAFPDGVFHYSCAACGALCCKGVGFGGSVAEMQRIYALYPEVEALATSREGAWVNLTTLHSGCVLLDCDHLCRLEKEHGKAAKPSVCNVFPFDNFTRIGEAIAVAPHSLCPLQLHVPARPGDVHGTHAIIAETINASAFWESWYPTISRASLHPSEDVEGVLRREEAFRDMCAAALGREPFYAVLRQVCVNALALDDTRARLARVLGLAVPHRRTQHDAVDDLLLALAPAIRVQLLRLDIDGLLRALVVGELLVRHTATAAHIPLSIKAVHELLITYTPVLLLLGHGDEPLVLSGTVSRKAPKFDDPGMVFATFIALKELGNGATVLPTLERTLAPALPTSERWVVLCQISSRLAPAIMRSGRW